MKKEQILSYVSKIYGILITLLMLTAFGPKLVGSVDKLEITSAFNWYDNPTGFFFIYLIGYIIIWIRPLWGSIIIALGCLLFFVVNPENIKFLEFFLIPVLLVSVLYLWHRVVKKRQNSIL